MTEFGPTHEHEPLETLSFGRADVLFADLDRTLIVSDELSQLAYAELRRSHPDQIEAIDAVANHEKENVGEGYEYLRLLEEGGVDIAPEVLATSIVQSYISDNGEIDNSLVSRVMTDGSIELLQKIQETGARIFMMTAGDELTQRFKLAIVAAVAEEYGVVIHGSVITKSSYAKADLVLDMYDETSRNYILTQANPNVLRANIPDPSALQGLTRATLYDDKEFHLRALQRPFVPGHNDKATNPIRWGNGGILRLVRSVSVGGKPDEEPLQRLTASEFANMVRAA